MRQIGAHSNHGVVIECPQAGGLRLRGEEAVDTVHVHTTSRKIEARGGGPMYCYSESIL
jgi:hypothetical protein